METFLNFLNYLVINTPKVQLSVKDIFLIVLIFLITHFVLNMARKYFTKKLEGEDEIKFVSYYGYVKYIVYIIILLIVLNSMGIPITGLVASAAALLLGVGLALQTFFQDIISGVFILIDQSVHVNDIIEIEGKVGKVTDIKLRTTKALTIDNKVLIIPNHFFLTNILFNWTQNEEITRESVTIGVAYGSDVQLVKSLLLEAASNNELVLDEPEPGVFFVDFGDSALVFKLIVTTDDSFSAGGIKSDLRFEIDRLFRANNISIPFPQRDIHIISPKNES